VTWLNNSRIAAIFGVVFLHTANGVVKGSAIGSDYWWIGNLCDSLARWCVPVFVMISGALLLDPGRKEDLKTFYRKRVSRILIPVMFWSLFFLLWRTFKGAVEGDPPSFVSLLKLLLGGTPYYHMWFLYMIMTLYIFTPFCRKIVANSSRKEMTTYIALAFLMGALNTVYAKLVSVDSRLFTNWFLSYIPFFFLGYMVRTSSRRIPRPVLWSVFLLSSFLTALGCYVVSAGRDPDAGLYFYRYLSVTVIPMSVSAMYLLRSWTRPIVSERFTASLSLLTLGVYLIHPVFLDTVEYLGFGPLSFHPAVSIPAIACITFGASLIASFAISRVPHVRRVI
jgi:surface polysaccharide O-acyltransferase-like enzyme